MDYSQSPYLGYEGRSYLAGIKLAKVNKIFKKLREPFETDEKSNIIDYNWHVDGILKNSQSYNKESELIEAIVTGGRIGKSGGIKRVKNVGLEYVRKNQEDMSAPAGKSSGRKKQIRFDVA